MKHRARPILLLAPLIVCCLILVAFVCDFSRERVVYETSIGSYSIRLVRHPRDNIWETRYLTGHVVQNGRQVSGPFWMGPLLSEEVEFAEYRYPDDEIVLVYDREVPNYILVAVDAKRGVVWPGSRSRQSDSANVNEVGSALLVRVNQKHSTKFEVADWHMVKRWNPR